MRTPVAATLAALLVGATPLGCGPGPKAVGPGAGNASGAGADSDLRLTLYRDGALVQDRRRISLAAGQGEVVIGGIARSIVDGTLRFGDVTGAGTPAHAAGFDLLQNERELPLGKQVTLRRDGEPDLTGELVSNDPAGWVLVTGEPTRPYVVVNPASVVAIRGPFEDLVGGSAVRWKLTPAAAGERLIETSYVTRDLRWNASYTLVLDESGSHATLTGALAVQNDTGAAFEHATITLIDADMPGVGGAATEAPATEGGVTTFDFGYKPAWDPPPPPEPPPLPTRKKKKGPLRRVVLPLALSVRESGQQVFTLVGERGKRIPAETTMVFDPVGKKLDSPSRTPVAGKSYGDSPGTEVYSSIELDLARSGIGDEAARQLPRGRVRLFQRQGNGALEPLGEAEMFGETPENSGLDSDGDGVPDGEDGEEDGDADAAADDSSAGRLIYMLKPAPPPAKKPPPVTTTEPKQDAESAAAAAAAAKKAKPPTAGAAVRISVGRVPQISGKRRQSDFDYDADGKRLVEEITVSLENRGDAPAKVIVREHLYRGQNWTLAYHSALGEAVKEGAQQFRLPVTVPAKGKARVVYRVVYTW